ncbi:WD40/YVTN/BNR-like repeat-containing protein [Catelliglobosispora koreensis]|uniref:WD40/YVTN/BNR-like repeat-containing protein n=1 Tax=Catelliglobosispora koreensis TaxID=129052 RepID=UPI00036EF13E|nr:hypothetical protein [Catelliglobosispora koreensis]
MTPLITMSLVASLSMGVAPVHQPAWTATADTGVTARLRGLSAVSSHIAWASGGAGSVLRTVDGGLSWQQVGPPDTATLQFRDIEAFDANRAVILSIGPGQDSRIYRTGDGGQTWTETFRNNDENAFYDCISFFDPWRGLALSDPVDGKFRILSTSDGGASWKVLPDTNMPAALEGEFAFAASGTCLTTSGHSAWFATGGGEASRVFRSHDRGYTWEVSSTAVPSGPTAGIYSLAFRDPWHGVAVGGAFDAPTSAPEGVAVTRDGGRSWTLARQEPGEYRSGAAWVPFTLHTVIAVGPSGSDISYNSGQTWTRFADGSLDTVDCARWQYRVCWASGEHGRVYKLS